MGQRVIFIEADDGAEIEICKAEVNAETDTGYLKTLLADVSEATDALSISFKTFAEANMARPGLATKLSSYRIAESWISRRLKHLGAYEHTGETERERRQARAITKLLEENRMLRIDLEAARKVAA